MDQAQSDSGETRPGETRPSDPDLHWTGWALKMLRETVEIDMRAKRLAMQQQATPAEPGALDFPLMQSRLSRSIRLSIAMTERIRADYLMRRDGRQASGEQQRRRQRREQATDAVVRAVALPEVAGDAERLGSMVRETLTEDEILDVQIDSLSPDEFVQAVCRKIGFPPPSIPLPQGWDDEAAIREADTLPARAGDAVDCEPADHEPAEPRPHQANESVAGRPIPEPSKPDSS